MSGAPVTAVADSRADAGKGRDQFGTAHLQGDLRRLAVSGGLVSAMAQVLGLGLTLIGQIGLARLLNPRDFGLVAMGMTVVGFLQIFRDAGLSTPTIQRENITHEQVSNLFWLNVALSGTASLAMAGSAPLIASFFREPQLVGISIALSAVFLLSGFAAQPLAVLNRQMQFGRVCVIELLSIAVGIAVGLTMAVLGSRHWALVGLTLSTAVSRLLATYALTSWRPARPTRGVGTRPLVTFGLNVTAVGFVYSFARLFDNLLIGRVLGSAAVGLYSRGTALVSRPLDQVVTPIYTVVVPALSRLQDQPDRYRKAFLQVFEALAIIAFLFTGLCLPLAYPLTVVILGPQWVAAAPIFAGLTISALFVPMSSAASWLYLSQGRGRELLFVASVSACTMIGSFVAGLPFGPAGVALAYSLGGVCLQLPVTFYVAGRRGPVSCGDLWLSLVRHLPLGIVVLGSIWALGALAPLSSPWMRLLWSLPVGGLAGAASILALPSSRRAAAWMWRSLREADFLGST